MTGRSTCTVMQIIRIRNGRMGAALIGRGVVRHAFNREWFPLPSWLPVPPEAFRNADPFRPTCAIVSYARVPFGESATPTARHATGATAAARPAASRRIRSLLSWLHLWVGLVAGSLFALIGLSGTVLVFHHDLLRTQHPQLWAPAPTSDGAVLAQLLDRWVPQGLTAIDLPRESLPVYQAYFSDEGRRYFDPTTGSLLLSRHPGNDALLWLHDLHTAILAGETGHELVGVIGWIAVGMLLTGLYLWWPARGRVLAQLRMYPGPPVRRWLTWHRSIGVLFLPFLLLATLTGVGMIYHDGARWLLTSAFGGDEGPTAPQVATTEERPPQWSRVLANAKSSLPGAELTRLSPPHRGSDIISLRARVPGEWHSNGRSFVFTDRAGERVWLTHDATAQRAGARMTEAIYPLHIGSVGGPLYRWLTALVGLLPTFLLVTGFLFWRRRAKHVSSKHGDLTPAATSRS